MSGFHEKNDVWGQLKQLCLAWKKIDFKATTICFRYRDSRALLYQLSYEALRCWEQANFGCNYPARGVDDVMDIRNIFPKMLHIIVSKNLDLAEKQSHFS